MVEAIGIIIAVLGLLLAWRTFKIDKIDDTKEVRKIAIEKLGFLSNINNALLSDLYNYGTKTDSFSQPFMQGLTLAQSIDILQNVRDKLLNAETFGVLEQSNSKMRLLSIKDGIDIQIKHHSEVRTFFDLYVKPTFINH